MNLSDKAMLASLNISQWTAKKHDKKVSKEVADNHQSDISMGRYNKSLIAKKALDKISKIAGAARIDFYELSLPWRDDGSRIITSSAYMKMTERNRKRSAEFQEAKEEFIANYPRYIEQAEKDLNGLFDKADYPSQSEISNKFRYAFHVFPLPIADDFRVKLSDAETAVIQQQITANLQESVKNAMSDVWKRMQTVLRHAANSLKEYKVTLDASKPSGVKIENPFRDSLVNNIRELLDIIPALNLTDSPDVAQFAQEMREVCKHDAVTLRDNDGTRKEVIQKAEDILSKMQQFI